MEGALKVWIVIVVVGALNYLSRLSFIAAFGRRSMPAWLARALKFVPAAMLTALVLPMIVPAPAHAAIAARIRRCSPRSPPPWSLSTRAARCKTLATGMLALWLLQWLLGAHG